MLKIRRSYSIGKLRKNILFAVKGDTDFARAAGNPQDMFFHIFDSIVQSTIRPRFYNIYVNDLPIGYLCIVKQTKEVFWYIDIQYRTRPTLTAMFEFVKKRIGNEFYTGTKKTNTRFIEFANRNGWAIEKETDKVVIFKGTCDAPTTNKK